MTEELTCEICGRPVHRKKYYKFQGLTLILCEICAKRLNAEEVIVVSKVQIGAQHRTTGKSRMVSKIRRRGLEELEYEYIRDFGDRICNARIRKGLELEKLARILGVSSSYLSKIERGKIKPDLYLAKKIERVLNIKILRRVDVDILESIGETYEDEVKPLTLGDVVIIERVKKKKRKE